MAGITPTEKLDGKVTEMKTKKLEITEKTLLTLNDWLRRLGLASF